MCKEVANNNLAQNLSNNPNEKLVLIECLLLMFNASMNLNTLWLLYAYRSILIFDLKKNVFIVK